MTFSLSSYLLGVGTIAGALAFGVGTGALMTKSALKDTTAAAATKVERVARSEPIPAAAPQVAEPKQNSAPPVEATAAVHPDPAPSIQPETPKADNRSEAAEKQPGPAKPGGSANQPEQKQAALEKPTERRVDRPRHYTERRTRRVPVAATRPSQSYELDPPERPELVYGREQPHRGFLGIFSPPPYDRSDDMSSDR
jgi:type IV secretory pathway VirB10-like protein